ncbi:MAG: hypothetical protein ACTSXC_03065 [Candidatus Freyarchaeota archaeon]
MRKKKEICPVCGKEGSGIYRKWVLNAKKKRYEPYYYFAHRYKDENGKWRIKWCYVGKAKPTATEKPSLLQRLKRLVGGFMHG